MISRPDYGGPFLLGVSLRASLCWVFLLSFPFFFLCRCFIAPRFLSRCSLMFRLMEPSSFFRASFTLIIFSLSLSPLSSPDRFSPSTLSALLRDFFGEVLSPHFCHALPSVIPTSRYQVSMSFRTLLLLMRGFLPSLVIEWHVSSSPYLAVSILSSSFEPFFLI